MKTRMKWAVLLSAFWIGLFSQTFAQEMSKQDYLDKSRNQKTTGFILLGGGVAMIAVGSILFADDAVDTAISCTYLNCSSGSGIESGMVISAVGGLAILGSIPVFISSGKNARKAAQVSLRNEPTYIPKYVGNIPRAIPSVSLSIPLN
ncbi:MAG: hypothetical protein PSV36_08640 [Algoriphagus sp.]|nr:hypothetical protein [Algoriphagus sp.]